MEYVYRHCPLLRTVCRKLPIVDLPANDAEVDTYNYVYHDENTPVEFQCSWRLCTLVYFADKYGCDSGHVAYFLGMVMNWDEDFGRFVSYVFQHLVFQVMDRRTLCRLINVIMILVDTFGADMDGWAGVPAIHYAYNIGCVSTAVFACMAQVDVQMAYIVFDSLPWYASAYAPQDAIPKWSDVMKLANKN